MHQSGVRGSRPLAARNRLRRRTLQQLQRSAPQCSASAGPTPADASSLAGQLPSAGPFARTAAVIAASDPQGRSSRSTPGRAVPANFFPKNRRLGILVAQASACGGESLQGRNPTGWKPVPLKPAPNRRLKWGERPVEGSGRSWGMGKFKMDAVEPKLSGPGLACGTDQTQEDQQQRIPRCRLRQSSGSSAVGRGLYLKPAMTPNSFNHAIILPASPARANGPRVTFASVLSYGSSSSTHRGPEYFRGRR